MMKKETENLLQRAAGEILALRQVNKVLQAKVDTMNFFECLLHTQPAYKGQGESEDMVSLLHDHVIKETLEAQAKINKEATEDKAPEMNKLPDFVKSNALDNQAKIEGQIKKDE